MLIYSLVLDFVRFRLNNGLHNFILYTGTLHNMYIYIMFTNVKSYIVIEHIIIIKLYTFGP